MSYSDWPTGELSRYILNTEWSCRYWTGIAQDLYRFYQSWDETRIALAHKLRKEVTMSIRAGDNFPGLVQGLSEWADKHKRNSWAWSVGQVDWEILADKFKESVHGQDN